VVILRFQEAWTRMLKKVSWSFNYLLCGVTYKNIAVFSERNLVALYIYYIFDRITSAQQHFSLHQRGVDGNES